MIASTMMRSLSFIGKAVQRWLPRLVAGLAPVGLIGQQSALILAGLASLTVAPTPARAAHNCSFTGVPASFNYTPTSLSDGPVWNYSVNTSCSNYAGVYFCYGSNFSNASNGAGNSIPLILGVALGASQPSDWISAGDSNLHGDYDTGIRDSNGNTYIATMTFTTNLVVKASPANVNGIPKGTYTTTIPLLYDMNAAGACDTYAGGVSGTSDTDTAYTTIPLTITVPSFCTVSSTAVAFGTVQANAMPDDATGTVGVNCNNAAAFTIGLGAGLNSSGSVRRMTDGSAHYLPYSLYTNSARSTAWTTSTTVAGTGSTGTTVNTTVYGRIEAGTTLPIPGNYSDTVTITITY